ncbi:hypothetical protein U27_03705 [Candidatus Vecturithrix granuli]|uniref:Uncharacterized protein n=1 Tax=Vecturithrix granuli TaxID=1499967 RepID=A0A081BWN6_VECG1|nr:hypothetical protein U27_03705 [Candidatus Vecturithrix granuli]
MKVQAVKNSRDGNIASQGRQPAALCVSEKETLLPLSFSSAQQRKDSNQPGAEQDEHRGFRHHVDIHSYRFHNSQGCSDDVVRIEIGRDDGNILDNCSHWCDIPGFHVEIEGEDITSLQKNDEFPVPPAIQRKRP